ncbi:MAG: MFS transporter [Alphaproteobacteria bacterium]
MVNLGRPPCSDGVIEAAPGVAGCARADKPWVLAAAILGSSMAFIDGSVVNVALPAMQADFAAPVHTLQWIVNAYMLMLGALILVGGSAGDRYGRRRVFVLGIALFTLASVACAVAPDAMTLILARAAQGIGGALLVPSSLAIISAAFPEEERGKAIGTWAGFSALTTALGPVLGGWLVDTLSWRAIFIINVPLAAATVAIALSHVSESRDEESTGAIDWRGAVLVVAGLGALTLGLTAASEREWGDPAVWGPSLGGVLLLGWFIRIEAHARAPMVPLSLFRSAAFGGANMMTLLLYFALSGALFFLPFNLIQIQGYSATLAGATFLPFTLIMGVLSRWSGALVDRFGARWLLIIGPIISAAGIALFALPGIGGSYWATYFPAMAVLGLGMAVSVSPLTTTVMNAVGKRHAGVASGINNAVSRIAGTLAIAILGVLAVGVFGAAFDARIAALGLSAEQRGALIAQVAGLAEIVLPDTLGQADRAALGDAVGESFIQSFRAVMLVCAALALLGALCAALTIRARRAPASH